VGNAESFSFPDFLQHVIGQPPPVRPDSANQVIAVGELEPPDMLESVPFKASYLAGLGESVSPAGSNL
jgi:hypothetical protein